MLQTGVSNAVKERARGPKRLKDGRHWCHHAELGSYFPPILASRGAEGGQKCRCGARLKPGALAFGFDHAPEPAASFVQQAIFCSQGCARAYLLEALELFESAGMISVVSDADRMASSLRGLLIRLLASGN